MLPFTYAQFVEVFACSARAASAVPAQVRKSLAVMSRPVMAFTSAEVTFFRFARLHGMAFSCGNPA